MTTSPTVAERMHWAEETNKLLAHAYQRPCFVCGRRGHCDHREPRVELAMMGCAAIKRKEAA